jgi:Na+(H+)/acetate symporter ActP
MKPVVFFCASALVIGAQAAMLVPSFADQDAIIRRCSRGPLDAQSLIAEHVAQQRAAGASAAQIDKQLTDMTVVLGEAALRPSSATTRRRLAGCVRQLAAFLSTQKGRVLQIATAIEDDDSGTGTSASAN